MDKQINIPGPGSAMALAAGAAAVASAIASSFFISCVLAGVAVLFGIFTLIIEHSHTRKKRAE